MSKWFGDVVAVSDVSLRARARRHRAARPERRRQVDPAAHAVRPDRAVAGHGPASSAAIPGATSALLGRIGLVPQQEALFDGQTALEFVRAGRHPARPAATRRGGRRRASTSSSSTRDDPRPVTTYSKGMRQRVKVAPGARPRPRRHRARRAAHRARPPPAPAHDRPVPPPRRRQGRCVVVSSHVLDEVERFGSRVLVIAQGRLAAEGDFRAIRDLMDDRPHRIRVRTDQARRRGRRPPRRTASSWASASTATDTVDRRHRRVHRFRHVGGRRRPASRAPAARSRRSTTTSTASSATWWADDRPGPHARMRADVDRAPSGSFTLRAQATRGAACWPRRPRRSSAMLIGLGRRRRRTPPTRIEAGTSFIDAFGLSLLVPVTTLVFASAALGDPADDGTLVYLWLRPVPRLEDRRRRHPGHGASGRCRSVLGPWRSAPASPAAGADLVGARSCRPPSPWSPTAGCSSSACG